MNKVWSALIKFSVLGYLQFLYFLGMFQSKKTWIDKQIISCYNKLNELGKDTKQYPKY